ncbi:MAG: hypothetical protein WC337_10565 [Candidatus Muiribacteriota bacterium]
MDSFENKINNLILEKDYFDAIKDRYISKSFKYRGLITDHDVVAYLICDDKVIILEIQCKNVNEFKKSTFKSIYDYKMNYGYFTMLNYKKYNHVGFKEIEHTQNLIYFDWRTIHKKLDDTIKSNSPLNQIIKSCFHTVYEFNYKFNLPILVFPIVCYSNNIDKVESMVYLTKLTPEKFNNPFLINWLKAKMRMNTSEINFNGNIPIFICNEIGLSKILDDMKIYKNLIQLKI